VLLFSCFLPPFPFSSFLLLLRLSRIKSPGLFRFGSNSITTNTLRSSGRGISRSQGLKQTPCIICEIEGDLLKVHNS
jgi:hypothetical protein